jgi:hypothetical protein
MRANGSRESAHDDRLRETTETGHSPMRNCASGIVRRHKTSDAQLRVGNLEIPGSMLRIAPE